MGRKRNNKELSVAQAIVIAVGVICITVLEVLAMYKGIDGMGLATAVGSIGGLVGYAFAQKQTRRTIATLQQKHKQDIAKVRKKYLARIKELESYMQAQVSKNDPSG